MTSEELSVCVKATETPFDLLNYSNYRMYNKTKIINIINIGEYHYKTPELNLDLFKDKKTCFYVETRNYIFNKKFTYSLFQDDNEYEENGIKHFTNINRLNNIFSYYYKQNSYDFETDYDKTIITSSKPYNKLWSFIPCDYRYIKYIDDYFYCIMSLYYYYILIINNVIKSNKDYMEIRQETFEHIKEVVNSYHISTTLEEIKNEFNNIDKYKMITNFLHPEEDYENPNINIDTINKIYQVINKYYNEDYFKIIDNFTDENVVNYFDLMDKGEFMIDMFNLRTYFYFEEKLNKYSCIKRFLNYYCNYYLKDNLNLLDTFMPYMIMLLCPIYDIGLYVNFCDNFQKYDYNVIYSGDAHRELFDIFIKFLNKDDNFKDYKTCN